MGTSFLCVFWYLTLYRKLVPFSIPKGIIVYTKYYALSREMMKKKRLIVLSVITICLVTVLYLLYYFNYIPHKKYNNENFNIKTYMSDIDKDNDGIDDQTDILINAREYM